MRRTVALTLAALSALGAVARADSTPQPSWISENAAATPSFLDTSDRRIKDDRPPPSAEQVTGLKELEAEVERFRRIGGAYRDTVVSLLRREYERQRRDREEEYASQIKFEEQLEDKARLDAIALFERFIQSYPSDPTYTPDAMFRLGELYFERDAIKQQEDMNAYLAERDRRLETGESMDTMIEPEKNYSATVALYQRLVQTFPAYNNLDGVYYLIGYCHNESGEFELARMAWLNLVCANRYTYTGEAPPSEGKTEEDERSKEHPALDLGKQPVAAPVTAFEDPYAGCEPAAKDSKFWAETWLRIGEYHFDFDFTPHGLNKAISAYSKVLERPDDRNYNLALYKVAWTYYRASRYPEALAHFWRLVQWSDEERKRTGKGSELREEAIQYLAIGFAYDDWNENQISDPLEGLPRGIDRLRDPKLMPQDMPWTSDVYFRLGYIYFDEAKYPEAIEAWQLSLRRWPMDPQAPEVTNNIAVAYGRFNQQAEAIAVRSKLSEYSEGTDWWEANKDHPIEQRRAEQLAEEALINTAVAHHQRAQGMRRRCIELQDPELCTQAQEQYGLAALAYRGYVKRYPNNPQAYELNYNLADALYWSENYEEAAKEYSAIRDSNLDDKYLSIAARLAVESVKRLVEKKTAAGEIQVRTEPPTPSGTPPTVAPIEMPEPLQRLARARELYLARVDEAHDTEKVRDSYFYNNTLLLYLYGYWDLARSRFYAEFEQHCVGPTASETGQVAWLNMRNMAVALGQTEEVRSLGAELQNRKCTFSATGAAVASVDCSKPENKDAPSCVAGQDLTNLRYRDAVAIFERAEKASGDEQRLLFEKAASDLVKAVNDEPNHPQAPLALEKAALALERTSRYESAGRLYQRIIDEVGPRKAPTPEEQGALDAILANAYFRLAYNANRFFDFDRAIDNYRTLADSQRFAASKQPQMAEWREGSLINAAKILEYQQQYARAAEYYARAAETLRDADEQRVARYRVAEMAFKLGQWTKAVTEMKAFIARYQGDKAAGELVVQAYARIAQAKKEQTPREAEAAQRDIVTAFARSGQGAGSFAAEYAAEAQFQEVDKVGRQFENFAITPGKPATLDSYVKGVAGQIEAGSREAKTKAESYNVIPPYRRPTWTIAAFVRQGRIYEVLARAVLSTPFVVPADLQKKMRGLPADSQDEIKIQIEDAIKQLLDSKVRPIECLAVARYALAARAARAGSIDNEFTREAFDRINAYGDERIAECIAQVAAQDSTFQAYQPGEFKRATRGQNIDMRTCVAAANGGEEPMNARTIVRVALGGARCAACGLVLFGALAACSDDETTAEGGEATSGGDWEEADSMAMRMPADTVQTPQAGIPTDQKTSEPTDYRPKISDAPRVQEQREDEPLPTGPSPWGAPDAQSGAALPPRHKLNQKALGYLRAGIAASSKGDNKAAKENFDAALASDPKAYEAVFNLGVLLDRQGQTSQALQAYANTLRKQPDYERAVEATVNIYLRQGSAEQAVAFVQPIAAKWERNLYLQAILAQALIEANRIDEAEQAARKALRRDERFTPAMIALANASLKRGRLELADSIIDQALTVDAKYPEAQFLQGKRHQQEGRLAQALESYRQAVQLRPDYPEARTALGIQYMAAGNYPQALAEFEAVVQLVPTLVSAHLNLGDAYRANRRWQDAKREFDYALRMQDNLPEAHFNLGLLYMEAGAEFPGLQLLDALQRAVLELSKYREQMGSRLAKNDTSATMIADLQRQIDREKKRIERDKARADRAARQPGAEAK